MSLIYQDSFTNPDTWTASSDAWTWKGWPDGWKFDVAVAGPGVHTLTSGPSQQPGTFLLTGQGNFLVFDTEERWNGSDPDQIEKRVQISVDDGQSWDRVATSEFNANGSIVLGLDRWSGHARLRFLVRVRGESAATWSVERVQVYRQTADTIWQTVAAPVDRPPGEPAFTESRVSNLQRNAVWLARVAPDGKAWVTGTELAGRWDDWVAIDGADLDPWSQPLLLSDWGFIWLIARGIDRRLYLHTWMGADPGSGWVALTGPDVAAGPVGVVTALGTVRIAWVNLAGNVLLMSLVEGDPDPPEPIMLDGDIEPSSIALGAQRNGPVLLAAVSRSGDLILANPARTPPVAARLPGYEWQPAVEWYASHFHILCKGLGGNLVHIQMLQNGQPAIDPVPAAEGVKHGYSLANWRSKLILAYLDRHAKVRWSRWERTGESVSAGRWLDDHIVEFGASTAPFALYPGANPFAQLNLFASASSGHLLAFENDLTSGWLMKDAGLPAAWLDVASAVGGIDYPDADYLPVLRLFMMASEGQLMEYTNAGGAWEWNDHGRLPGKPAGGLATAPSAVTWEQETSDGSVRRVSVFVLAIDGSTHILAERSFNGSKWEWVQHGKPENASVHGRPSAVIFQDTGAHQIMVFARISHQEGNRESSRLAHFWSAGGPGHWEDHGEPPAAAVASAPAAVTYWWKRRRRMHIFCRGADGRLLELRGIGQIRSTGTVWNWEWLDLGFPADGVRCDSAPAAVGITPESDRAVHVFVSGTDGALYEAWLHNDSDWQWIGHGRPPEGLELIGPSGVAARDEAGSEITVAVRQNNGRVALRQGQPGVPWKWLKTVEPAGSISCPTSYSKPLLAKSAGDLLAAIKCADGYRYINLSRALGRKRAESAGLFAAWDNLSEASATRRETYSAGPIRVQHLPFFPEWSLALLALPEWLIGKAFRSLMSAGGWEHLWVYVDPVAAGGLYFSGGFPVVGSLLGKPWSTAYDLWQELGHLLAYATIEASGTIEPGLPPDVVEEARALFTRDDCGKYGKDARGRPRGYTNVYQCQSSSFQHLWLYPMIDYIFKGRDFRGWVDDDLSQQPPNRTDLLARKYHWMRQHIFENVECVNDLMPAGEGEANRNW